MTPEESKTPTKKRNSWKIAAIFIGVFLTLVFPVTNSNLFSFPTKMVVNETAVIEEHNAKLLEILFKQKIRGISRYLLLLLS